MLITLCSRCLCVLMLKQSALLRLQLRILILFYMSSLISLIYGISVLMMMPQARFLMIKLNGYVTAMILLERTKMPSLFYGLLSKGKPVKTDVFTNSGRKEMPNYGWSINENGEEVLVVKSYTNIQEKINSVHDSVALPLLIKRFMDGDEAALSANKASAFYDDITALPSNMHDAHRLMVEMREQFDSMPYEDRAFFNNDFNQFIASSGNGNFLNFLETKLNKDIDGDGIIGDVDDGKDGDVNE